MIEHIRVPFLQAAYDATAGNRKVKRKDYLPEGPIPVLDQGQDFIAGYTTTDNAYTGQLPAVLFGDHTRIFKYVDFPFALGADGVKVLIPQEGFDASFLYHYFRNAHIPSAGYSRHFKFLRELSVCKPPLSEQRQIVSILNRATKIERLRTQAEERVQEFIPALFTKMFGEPTENPALDRRAGGDDDEMKISTVPLGELATSIESGFACGKSNLVEQGLLHIRPFNIGKNGDLDLTLKYQIPSDVVPSSKAILCSGDILFNNTNSRDLVGKCAVVRKEIEAGFSNHITRIRVDPDFCEPLFVAAHMQYLWSQGYFRDNCTQWVNQAAFGNRHLTRLKIPLPPLDVQKKILENC